MDNQSSIEKKKRKDNVYLDVAIDRAYRSSRFHDALGNYDKAEEQLRLGDWLSELQRRRKADE